MNRNQPDILAGKPAANGIGIGKARFIGYRLEKVHPREIETSEIDEHVQKFERALDVVEQEYERVRKLPGNSEAEDIIRAQIEILRDPEFHSAILSKIRNEKLAVDYAIFSTLNSYIQLMEQTGVKWANERTLDITSIRDELVRATREERRNIEVGEGDIVFAKEVTPTDMVQLSQNHVAGIVMEKGGLTSHSVILSQSLGIPCVIHVHWDGKDIQEGSDVVIDGSTGQVILYPDLNQKEEYEKRKEDEEARLKKRLEWTTKPNRTRCGADFTLRGNVEFLEELPRLESFGANGVGLLRTESLFFSTDNFNIEEQIEFYSRVAESAGKNPVVIRLFDAGGDKLPEGFEEEDNPFLGWRGVRMLLDRKELLRNQLEAIYRVSGKHPGKLKILIPMVSGIEEIREVKEYCKAVQRYLDRKEVSYDANLEIGIMVEVPSIALIAEEAADHCDFFSIGTNDLTQYTLAADRGNEKIASLFDSYHPSVWRLIRMTAEAGARKGINVAVCGEMAGRPEAAACLLGMGVRDLSMNPTSIPSVKAVLCGHSEKEMKKLADSVLKSSTTHETHQYLDAWRKKR